MHAEFGNEEHAADYGEHHIQHVAYVEEGGRKHICIPVCPAAGFIKPVVDLVEALLGGLFVAESFDYLLADEHLFDIPLLFTYRLLLLYEVARTAAAYLFGYDEHNSRARKHDEREPQAVIEHYEQHRKHGYARNEYLRRRLGYELAESIYIVGIVAHYVAVAGGIEELYWQFLHTVEHLVAQLFKRALGDYSHKLAERRARGERRQIKRYEDIYVVEYGAACLLPRGAVYKRVGNVLNYPLHKYGGNGAHYRRKRNAGYGYGKEHGIEGIYRFKQAPEHALFLFSLQGRGPPCSARCILRGKWRCAL